MIIDKLQTHSHNIPFPSITICPDFEPNNESIYETINKIYPNITDATKYTFKIVLLKLFNLQLTNYDKVELDVEDEDFHALTSKWYKI